jgi:hypothetical protein
MRLRELIERLTEIADECGEDFDPRVHTLGLETLSTVEYVPTPTHRWERGEEPGVVLVR